MTERLACFILQVAMNRCSFCLQTHLLGVKCNVDTIHVRETLHRNTCLSFDKDDKAETLQILFQSNALILISADIQFQLQAQVLLFIVKNYIVIIVLISSSKVILRRLKCNTNNKHSSLKIIKSPLSLPVWDLFPVAEGFPVTESS